MKKLLMLVLVLLVILPMMVSAEKGMIVGYYQTYGKVSDAQLDNLSHLILFQIFANPDGRSLNEQYFYGNSKNKDADIKDVVDRAHAKGKKVIIAIGGAGAENQYFMNATSSANRPAFVQAIVNLVNKHNLDGVDLDWETQVDWERVLDLCLDLKNAKYADGKDKRISVTIGADSPYCQYNNHFKMDARVLERYKNEVWKLDAVQLMTYDMGSGLKTGQNKQINWNSSADANASEQAVAEWAAFGQGKPGFSKEKILIGAHSSQDTDAAARQKVRFAQQNGYGGAILWQIDSKNYLNSMWDENNKYGGHTGGTITPPKDPTRHNVPTTGYIPICDYSNISQINTTGWNGNKEQCENGTNIGYMTAGSFVEYLIKVNGAGSYKIKMKTANGDNAVKTITITGGGANGTISVPAGSDWTTYTERETDIQLNNGDVTLKISVSGGVNFKDISITKNSGPEPCTHNWMWVTTIQPKCDADGIKVEKCSKCQETKNETIVPKTGNCGEPTDDPDLADGSWEDAWSAVYDEGKNGSSLSITSQGNPLSATWKLGDEPDWEIAGDDDAPYAGIGFYTGDAADWSKITEVVIQYSSNQSTYLALSSSNGHEYFVELPAGNNKTMTFSASSFQKFDWDAGSHSLNLSEVNGIVIAALNSYGATTNITITSLIVKGLLFEDVPSVAVVPNKTTKSVSVMNVGIMNGTLNLSLPSTSKNAMVTMFDVRGRMLMQQQISINSGFASVALPKNIAQNQAVILQVKTNSGVNLTKRILIK